MRVLVASLSAVLVASGPMAEPFQAKLGYFSISCAGEAPDPYGNQTRQPTCSATYMPPADYGYWQGSQTIFEVNKGGPRLGRIQLRSVLCRQIASKVAVDGVRIDQLPPEEQVKRVLKGSTFAREDHGSWPRCGLHNNSVRLEKAPEAYETMMKMWNKYRVGR